MIIWMWPNMRMKCGICGRQLDFNDSKTIRFDLDETRYRCMECDEKHGDRKVQG